MYSFYKSIHTAKSFVSRVLCLLFIQIATLIETRVLFLEPYFALRLLFVS